MKLDEAMKMTVELLDTMKRKNQPRSTLCRVVGNLEWLAKAYRDEGKFGKTEECLYREVREFEEAGSPDYGQECNAGDHLGICLAEQGKSDAAR